MRLRKLNTENLEVAKPATTEEVSPETRSWPPCKTVLSCSSSQLYNEARASADFINTADCTAGWQRSKLTSWTATCAAGAEHWERFHPPRKCTSEFKTHNLHWFACTRKQHSLRKLHELVFRLSPRQLNDDTADVKTQEAKSRGSPDTSSLLDLLWRAANIYWKSAFYSLMTRNSSALFGIIIGVVC